MLTRWKTFSDNIKRYWCIAFENRDIVDIQNDYYADKWISKSELIELFEFEKSSLITRYTDVARDYHDLMSGFNLNAYSNYQKLEENNQGKLSQSFKPKA